MTEETDDESEDIQPNLNINTAKKEKIPRTTDFVFIRRCTNCGTNNPKNALSCKYCRLLFTSEITYEQWIKKNTEKLKEAN